MEGFEVMANFRIQSGMFLKVIKPIKDLIVGKEYQVILSQWGSVAFIGHNNRFHISDLSGCVEPVYPKEN